MKPYLTPERFRLMRTGAVLTGIPDIEIREVIGDAQAIVDAYCNVPLLPTPHSFRGGEALLEEHEWHYPEYHWDPGQRRIYPYHHPIIEVSEFRLLVAPGATAAIPNNSLVISHSERWVEVTSLAIASNSGLFGVTGWIVPIGGLSNPMAQISYTYGRQIVVVGDRAYPIADDETLIFQTSLGCWNAIAEVTVYDAGVEVDPGDYTLDREVGRVTFTAPPAGPVTVDYTGELDRDFTTATAHITAYLLGASKASAKGLSGGIQRVKVGEISFDRGTPAKDAAHWLPQAVPSASLLLDGHRFWRLA